MMDKKALFFDIDGTLLSEITHMVPGSAAAALSEARKEGHRVFINSGRTLCLSREIFGLVETDGCLCGCGTHIEVAGQVLYSRQIPRHQGQAIKKAIVDFGLDGVLEGTLKCYFQKQESRFEGLRNIKKSAVDSGQCSPFTWDDDCYEFDKFCVFADEYQIPLFPGLKQGPLCALRHNVKGLA